MALSLSKLVDSKRENEGEWFQYGDTTFHVKLAFYTREKITDLLNSARIKKPDPRNPRNFTEELDNDKFRNAFVPKIIKDWRGLTLKVLSTLVVIDYEGEENEEAELPYSNEEALLLVAKSAAFDSWVTGMCADVEAFNKAKKENALKNFSTAPATS